VAVELKRTRYADVSDAAEQLRRVGTPLLGAVVLPRLVRHRDEPPPPPVDYDDDDEGLDLPDEEFEDELDEDDDLDPQVADADTVVMKKIRTRTRKRSAAPSATDTGVLALTGVDVRLDLGGEQRPNGRPRRPGADSSASGQ
jgi:hypothetical protein